MSFVDRQWLRILTVTIACFTALACSQDPKPKNSRNTQVTRQDLAKRITISGKIEPKRSATIAAPYEGYIKKLYVKTGDQVKENQALVTVSQSLVDVGQNFPLRSPLSGHVVQVLKEEGEYVTKGGENNYILRVDDLSKLFVSAKVPEIDIPAIKVGQEATIKVSALLGQSYKAIVQEAFLAPSAQEGWGNQAVEFPIKLEIQNHTEDLKPGMTAIIDIVTAKKEDALVLPHEYIQKRKGEHVVTLSSGREKPVEIGLQNDMYSEVLNLEEGTEVQPVDFYKETE